MNTPETHSMLSDEEVKTIICNACSGEGSTETQITKIVEWAHESRLRSVLLDMILTSKVFARWGKDGLEIISNGQLGN